MSVHSHIGASSMHRWSACPGSVRLSKGIVSVSSKYADEGTLAHEMAAHILMGREPVAIDPDMLEAVNVYVSAVLEASKGIALFLVEQHLDLSTLHPGLFGTADAIVYDQKTKLLQVFDYKHGAGIAVEVENNEQLMYYALGARLMIEFPVHEIELVIVQPRCPHPDGPVRRWRFDAFLLLDFAADLIEAAKRTEDPNAPIVPGDHCRFCPAAPTCPALHTQALTLAKQEFSPSLSYDPEKLSQTLSWLPALEGFIKNVREFAYREAEHGRCPPRFKLVQKRATRRWKNEHDAIQKLQKDFHLEIKDICTLDLKSPAQVERYIEKDLRAEFSNLITAESSGYTLAPESDKREAAKIDAASEFSKIEN